MNIDLSFQQVGSKPNLDYKLTAVCLGSCFVFAQEGDLVFFFGCRAFYKKKSASSTCLIK